MTRPSMWRLAAVLLVAAMAAGDLDAQTPSTSSRNRRVWTGTIDDREVLLGEHDTTPIRRPVQYFQNVQVSFTFVSEDVPDRPGFTRWLSRQLSWTAYGYSASSIERYECQGSGSLDLGPADGADHTTPEQDERLRVPCKNITSAPNVWAFIKRPNPKVHLPDIDLGMTTCEPPRRWSVGGVRYTLAVAGADRQVTAVVDPDPDQASYQAFVPQPGRSLTLTARSSSGPVRFRFVLDPSGTSRFPGYATNANVDAPFRESHGLTDLPGGYANDSPDVIFLPRNFDRGEWSTVSSDTVETKEPQTSASVIVTALDYGAVGRLRAYAQAADCAAGWQPIVFRVGGHSRDSLAIPLDEDDNLMADALEDYRGLDAGADADDEPKGNGMAGDGLTAFEEYRGFLTRGSTCYTGPPPAPDPDLPMPEPFPDEDPAPPEESTAHFIRTTPRHKNLFVHVFDPELALYVEGFAWSSDLSVHLICEPHYVDNATRIVNFTLQRQGIRAWRGKTISQEEPQHGVYIEAIDFRPNGLGGRVLAPGETPDREVNAIGPPKFSEVVLIYKPWLEHIMRRMPDVPDYGWMVAHELSHTVGIPHHGDRVEQWQVVPGKRNITLALSPFQRAGGESPTAFTDEHQRVLRSEGLEALLAIPGTDCIERNRLYRNGQFAGCWATVIARRGQQNSGDFDCPIRYPFAQRHEAPGSAATYRWTDTVTAQDGSDPIRVDAWEGTLPRYQIERDRQGTGQLCTSTLGTEINASGAGDHNGDSAGKPCRDALVVNDLAARGVR
jgi:hypothetical protein